MGLKPPNPPHPLATAGPSPGVLDAGHNILTAKIRRFFLWS